MLLESSNALNSVLTKSKEYDQNAVLTTEKFKELLNNSNLDLSEDEKTALVSYFDATINSGGDTGIYTYGDFTRLLEITQNELDHMSGN